jgi:hypothetical protein
MAIAVAVHHKVSTVRAMHPSYHYLLIGQETHRPALSQTQRPTSLSPPRRAPCPSVLGTGRDDHLDIVARRTIDERGVVALMVLLPDPWGSIARPAIDHRCGVELVYLLSIYPDSVSQFFHPPISV